MNDNSLTVKTSPQGVQEADQATRLAVIEYRIHEHMTNAAGHLLGVGQCLNEAKAGGLVPHGEWENWVLRNTGFTVRQAQRMMNAARQVPEGSVLAQLPFSKIQACLQLPSADEREAMAQRTQDENLTLRQLQDEVRREKQRADAAEARAAKAAGSGKADVKAQAEIDRLRGELADAEDMIEQQATLRQQAQQELLNYKAQAARGDMPGASHGLTSSELLAAVNTFMGSAGVLVHMGSALASIPAEDKERMQGYVDAMAEWVECARRALCTVYIDGDE